jgi:ankyrin repeat protein
VHSAAQSGKVEIVKLLRRLGAKPDGTTVRGVLPIHVAAEGGRGEVVDELLRWCPELLEVGGGVVNRKLRKQLRPIP